MLLAVAVVAVAAATARAGEDVTVPARVQAQLLVAVASFQSNMNLAADGSVQILVLTKNDDASSERVARQLVGALGDMKKIARRPTTSWSSRFTTPRRWPRRAANVGSRSSTSRRAWATRSPRSRRRLRGTAV